MVIFRRTQRPAGGVISGRKGLAIPFLSQDKEAGGIKVITSLIKIIINLNKVREEVKTLWEIISFLIRNF